MKANIIRGSLFAIFLLFPMTASSAYATTATVGTGPIGIAFDSHLNEMFVTNPRSNTISVIPDSGVFANTVIKTITVGTGPYGVAFDSHLNEIFVADWGSGTGNTLSVISDASNNVTATITDGP